MILICVLIRVIRVHPRLIPDSGGGFEAIHDEETSWDLSFRSLPVFDPLAIRRGGVTHVFVEQTAERAQALKADFKTHVGDAQIIGNQKLLGFLNTALDQILVRRFIEGLPEKPEEVITRKTGLAGHLVQTQWMVVTMIDERARPAKTLVRVGAH